MQLDERLRAALPVSCRARLQLYLSTRCPITIGSALLFAPTIDFVVDSTTPRPE